MGLADDCRLIKFDWSCTRQSGRHVHESPRTASAPGPVRPTVLEQDLVSTLLKSVGRIHLFGDHADAGLFARLNDLILSWPMSSVAASSARVMVLVAPHPLGLIE